MKLKPPPQRLFADSAPTTGLDNYFVFGCPQLCLALAARVKSAGKEFVGEQRKLYLAEEQPGEEAPYERLLGDAMDGDGALFTREDAVRPPWRRSTRSSRLHNRSVRTGAAVGGRSSSALIAADGCWHNPRPSKEASG